MKIGTVGEGLGWSCEWEVHESPFITAVNEALYQLTDIDIPAAVDKGPRAPRN